MTPDTGLTRLQKSARQVVDGQLQELREAAEAAAAEPSAATKAPPFPIDHKGE